MEYLAILYMPWALLLTCAEASVASITFFSRAVWTSNNGSYTGAAPTRLKTSAARPLGDRTFTPLKLATPRVGAVDTKPFLAYGHS